MTHPLTTMEWHDGIRLSRVFVMVWSARPEYAAIQRQKLAYAMQLGKPIRLLALEARLPEDLCIGYADVQGVRVATIAEAKDQIEAWLAAVP